MRSILILFSSLMITASTLSAQNHQPQGITVEGEGIVKVKPDRIKIKVRVENKGQEADPVRKKTDETVHKVIQFLKKEKISESDYKTDYVNLGKSYDYNTKETHYTATQALSITLKDIDRYNVFMNGLMESGINRIDGVSFEDSQLEKHRSEARIKAVENAKKKAEDYAGVLGLKVGRAVMVNEKGISSPSPRPMLMRAASADANMGGEETLAVGEMEIIEQVEIRFNLLD